MSEELVTMLKTDYVALEASSERLAALTAENAALRADNLRLVNDLETEGAKVEALSRENVELRKSLKEEGDVVAALQHYFIEYVTHYDHEPPDDAIEGLRSRLIWD